MVGLLQQIVEFLQGIWPIKSVPEGQLGGIYRWGKFTHTVGPGRPQVVVPGLREMKCFPVIPAIVGTPRLDITLADGTTLSYKLSAVAQVEDFHLAINTIDSYTESTQELLSAISADRLASAAPDLLKPESRSDLLGKLRDSINTETRKFGIGVKKVRFTTFVRNIKTIRLLQEGVADAW